MREGLANFNFRRRANHKRQGVSAMLRVKNEASKIYYALKSIYQVFDEIVLVDNASTDRTLEIAREFKTKEDKSEQDQNLLLSLHAGALRRRKLRHA